MNEISFFANLHKIDFCEKNELGEKGITRYKKYMISLRLSIFKGIRLLCRIEKDCSTAERGFSDR